MYSTKWKREPACVRTMERNLTPYLSRRMLVHGLGLPVVLNLMGKKSWDIPHLDTMEMWKFGDHKHYTSLDLLTAIFDIPTSKTVMDGSQVHHVYCP